MRTLSDQTERVAPTITKKNMIFILISRWVCIIASVWFYDAQHKSPTKLHFTAFRAELCFNLTDSHVSQSEAFIMHLQQDEPAGDPPHTFILSGFLLQPNHLPPVGRFMRLHIGFIFQIWSLRTVEVGPVYGTQETHLSAKSRLKLTV